MTPEELKAIEERAAAATPGDWTQKTDKGCTSFFSNNQYMGMLAWSTFFEQDICANADFLIRSRQDIPALLLYLKQIAFAIGGLPQDLLEEIDNLKTRCLAAEYANEDWKSQYAKAEEEIARLQKLSASQEEWIQRQEMHP